MKTYIITDLAPTELKRRANAAGEITMSDRAAKYELMRGTLREPVAADKAKPVGKPAPTPVLANGGN